MERSFEEYEEEYEEYEAHRKSTVYRSFEEFLEKHNTTFDTFIQRVANGRNNKYRRLKKSINIQEIVKGITTVHKVGALLSESFLWSITEEGSEFWDSVTRDWYSFCANHPEEFILNLPVKKDKTLEEIRENERRIDFDEI